jgi:uncharacterized membrane protein
MPKMWEKIILTWTISLRDTEFTFLDTPVAWVLQGVLIGMTIVTIWQLLYSLSRSRFRWIYIPVIYFFILIMIVVVNSIKIKFDPNSWEIFLYVIIAIIIWGIICGVVALIRWKRTQARSSIPKVE